MNNTTDMVKTDFKNWFNDFWYVLRKPNHSCTIFELGKKHSFHRRMGFSWLITNLVVLSIMIEMFSQGKASLTIMVIYMATLLCLYDEMQTKTIIELFMFWKQKELLQDVGVNDGIETK